MFNLKLEGLINFVLGFLWIYQGLVPKILFTQPEEILIWQRIGFDPNTAQLACYFSGVSEIIFGILWLCLGYKFFHFVNILALILLLILLSILQPSLLVAAFNPVVMNIAMISLSYIYLKYLSA
ncbi:MULTISPECIES: DoxX-like family protein [unclassified Acinetobacter]|uniref:DoxX-like family protein n=1 Tax=unclassified Acinetobacter TaxID=196816 RepID=UPI002934F3AD|nr:MULTISPECIES: DoxX-like family protein [unclassified Acinetobacter]WOE32424.1 DoxX-like family protein [Acinetobacter sp. SAAs470]WOE37898.1 DoxX-like family protein [Acinetobacter sp. SAAs474]